MGIVVGSKTTNVIKDGLWLQRQQLGLVWTVNTFPVLWALKVPSWAQLSSKLLGICWTLLFCFKSIVALERCVIPTVLWKLMYCIVGRRGGFSRSLLGRGQRMWSKMVSDFHMSEHQQLSSSVWIYCSCLFWENSPCFDFWLLVCGFNLVHLEII